MARGIFRDRALVLGHATGVPGPVGDEASETVRGQVDEVAGFDPGLAAMVPALEFGGTHLAEAPGKRVQHLDLMPANHAGISDRYLAGFTRMLLQDVLDWIEWYPLFGSTFRAIARRGHSGLDGP